jgi:hypothetical protein
MSTIQRTIAAQKSSALRTAPFSGSWSPFSMTLLNVRPLSLGIRFTAMVRKARSMYGFMRGAAAGV